jgi:hypothetical protein
MKSLNYTPWGCGEWLYLGGLNGSLQQQWYQAFTNSLTLGNNRFLDLYNWQGLKQNSSIMAAIQQVLSESLPCLVDIASEMGFKRLNSSAVDLFWTTGADTDKLTLIISSTNQLTPGSGLLQNADILTRDVSGMTSITITNLQSGPVYYWQLVSDGCSGTQRMVSDYQVFSL